MREGRDASRAIGLDDRVSDQAIRGEGKRHANGKVECSGEDSPANWKMAIELSPAYHELEGVYKRGEVIVLVVGVTLGVESEESDPLSCGCSTSDMIET